MVGSSIAKLWTIPFNGASPNSFIPASITDLPEPAPAVNPDDPYNITGTYMRVCTAFSKNSKRSKLIEHQIICFLGKQLRLKHFLPVTRI